MKLWRRIGTTVLLAALLSAVSAFSRAQDAGKNTKFPQRVLIIRHAEKTGLKDDVHLSKQGVERADVLHQLFLRSDRRPDPFPTPDFVFAASDSANSHRPVETVTPLARKLKLSINDRYHSSVSSKKNAGKDNPAKIEGATQLRDEIFGKRIYFGKTILVSWRHSKIPELARTLKAAKVPQKWADNVFDRVWQIDYDDKGNASFRDRPQRLLPGDAEK